jgi:hypothetical protein
MKKKILAMFAIVAVFGLAIAAYAYTKTNVTTTTSASCCKDSCPMKNKDGNHAEHGKDHAKGEGHNCCGESCPMKGEHGKSADHAKKEGHNCCGDSCPMKKKDGEAKTTAVSASEEGKSYCDNCDCCKGKEKPKTAAA